MSRLGWYAGASTALAVGVVASAFQQRANFYSAMVHLAQSNLSVSILANLAFLMYGSLVYSLQRLCFGPLRPVEIEQLWEKAWFAITETCLAMTIFREEIGPFFVVMFTSLVTGKIWGWICEGRVEVLEQQPPANPRLFHTRLVISLSLSILYDLCLLNYAVKTVVQQARPSMMVMFLFEFAVLAISSLHTTTRYMITLWEYRTVKKQTQRRLEDRRREVREQRAEILRRRETEGTAETDGEPLPNEEDIDEMDIEVPGWEAKGLYVLALDLCADFIKLLIYSTFFCVLFTFYGLPIHIMRDLFLTTRSFVKRLTAILRYQQALRDMNRYPDATAEDLGREDTCIICREEMQPWDPANAGQVERSRPKKLPCGHILHFGCLKSWLERQQVCPTCRRPVVINRPPQARNNRNGMVFRFGFNLLGNNNQNQQPPVDGAGGGIGAAPDGGQGGPPALGGGGGGQIGQDNGRDGGNGGFQLRVGPIRLVVARGGLQDLQDVPQRFPPQDEHQAAAGHQQLPQPQVQQQHGTAGNNQDLPASAAIQNIYTQLHQVNQQVIQATEQVRQDVVRLGEAEAQLAVLTALLQELNRLNARQVNAPQMTVQVTQAEYMRFREEQAIAQRVHEQLLQQEQIMQQLRHQVMHRVPAPDSVPGQQQPLGHVGQTPVQQQYAGQPQVQQTQAQQQRMHEQNTNHFLEAYARSHGLRVPQLQTEQRQAQPPATSTSAQMASIGPRHQDTRPSSSTPPPLMGQPGVPAGVRSMAANTRNPNIYNIGAPATAIPAGSPDLPEGVVIPPGWSLLPLGRPLNSPIPRQPTPSGSSAAATTLAPQPANGYPGAFARTPSQDALRRTSPAPTAPTATLDSLQGAINAATQAGTAPSQVGPTQNEARATNPEASDGETTEPHVTAPTPTRVPTWGGFGTVAGPNSSSLEHQADDASSSVQREGIGAGASSSTEKGKGKPVTVEEAGSDGEDEQ